MVVVLESIDSIERRRAFRKAMILEIIVKFLSGNYGSRFPLTMLNNINHYKKLVN